MLRAPYSEQKEIPAMGAEYMGAASHQRCPHIQKRQGLVLSLTLPTNSPVVFPSWHASCILWQQLYVIVSLGTYSHRQGRDTTLVLNGLMKQKSPFALSPMFSVTPPVVGKRPHQAGQFKTHWLYMYKQFSFKFLLPPSHYVAPLLPSCLPPFLEVTHSGLFFVLLSLVS